MEVGRGEEVRERWRDGERGRKREKEKKRMRDFLSSTGMTNIIISMTRFQ